jgi:lipoprotein-anchoring transpeptidase ErfK/SrfK
VKRKIQPYFAISVIALLFVILIYSFLSSKSSIPCANSLSCADSLQLKVENDAVGVFNKQKIVPPPVILSGDDTNPSVLGETSTSEEKHVYVDLTKQKIYAFQGDVLFMQASISSGKWNRTPTGDFTVWTKIRATRMRGGSGADYYNLPNVPYVMFFSNNKVPAALGYSLHGTYWHNNFGYPMSHGCINMKITDAEKLYNWADNKIKVTIYGQAPV